MIRTKLVLVLGLLLGLVMAVPASAANPPILASVLLGVTVMEARTAAALSAPSSNAPAETTAKLKEKLLSVPTGTMIEVKLLNKEKVRGRLGQIDDQGFFLTTSDQGRIVTRNLAFTEVSAVRQVEGGKAGHRVLWMLAGVGALVVIAIVIAAAQLL